MSLYDIIEIQQSKKDRDIKLYKEIYDKVRMKINSHASFGALACVYKIPSLIFGYPFIKIPNVMEYLLLKLNHEGFIAISLPHSYSEIFISWELTSVLKAKIKKEQEKNNPSVITSLENLRDDDLIRSLVKSKR